MCFPSRNSLHMRMICDVIGYSLSVCSSSMTAWYIRGFNMARNLLISCVAKRTVSCNDIFNNDCTHHFCKSHLSKIGILAFDAFFHIKSQLGYYGKNANIPEEIVFTSECNIFKHEHQAWYLISVLKTKITRIFNIRFSLFLWENWWALASQCRLRHQ